MGAKSSQPTLAPQLWVHRPLKWWDGSGCLLTTPCVWMWPGLYCTAPPSQKGPGPQGKLVAQWLSGGLPQLVSPG